MSAYKVFENDSFLGFLDIFPRSKGHTLIIPKKHVRWVYEVADFGAYWEAAHVVTKAIQKSLHPKWISYFTYGAVPHAHIHILPRFEAIDSSPGKEEIVPETTSFTPDEMEETARAIAGQIK